MLDKNHYIKLLKEAFSEDFFLEIEELKVEYCKELYELLEQEKIELGGNVFKGLKKIKVSYVEWDDENTMASYEPNEKILKINGRYYGEKADKGKELCDENQQKLVDRRFDILVTHELWHYYVREYNLIGNTEWDEVKMIYINNKDYILGFFKFINSYSEERRLEEFIVETFAYLKAGVLYNKIKSIKYIKKFKLVEGIFDLYKKHINYNLEELKYE